MMTYGLFVAFYYGMLEKTGWTSAPAKALLGVISAWFACVGLVSDMILMPLWLFGKISDRLKGKN